MRSDVPAVPAAVSGPCPRPARHGSRFPPRLRVPALLLAALLAGCYEGDPSDLREAVVAGRYQVTALDVRAPATVIETGTQVQLRALADTADGARVDLTSAVTWRSSAPQAVSIDRNGLATGTGNGTATITAELGVINDTASLTSSSAKLVAIRVEGADSLDECRDAAYRAQGDYDDGTRRDITALVGWQTGAGNPARFGSAAGLANRLYTRDAGTVQVYAVRDGIRSPAFPVAVQDTLTRLVLVPGSTGQLAEGDDKRFTATGYWGTREADVTRAAAWSVKQGGGDTVASVSNGDDAGVLRAEGGGEATLVVRCGGLDDRAAITVVFLQSLSVTNDQPIELAPGDEVLLVLEGSYSDGGKRPLNEQATWKAAATSGEAVTVSNAPGSRGLVTAGDPGISQVTATVGDKDVTVTVTVSDSP